MPGIPVVLLDVAVRNGSVAGPEGARRGAVLAPAVSDDEVPTAGELRVVLETHQRDRVPFLVRDFTGQRQGDVSVLADDAALVPAGVDGNPDRDRLEAGQRTADCPNVSWRQLEHRHRTVRLGLVDRSRRRRFLRVVAGN